MDHNTHQPVLSNESNELHLPLLVLVPRGLQYAMMQCLLGRMHVVKPLAVYSTTVVAILVRMHPLHNCRHPIIFSRPITIDNCKLPPVEDYFLHFVKNISRDVSHRLSNPCNRTVSGSEDKSAVNTCPANNCLLLGFEQRSTSLLE